MTVSLIGENNIRSFVGLLPRSALHADNNLIRLGVIDNNGTAAGMICVRLIDRRAEIISLYIVPGCRREGYASALINRLEEALRSNGIDAVSGEFLDDGGNSRFMKAMGYELFESKPQYSFTYGAVKRTRLYRRYIKDKTFKGNIKRISELSKTEKKIFHNAVGSIDYDRDWSTVSIDAGGRFKGVLLAGRSGDNISIKYIENHESMGIIFHLRALMEKTEETFGGRTTVIFRATFRNEKLIENLKVLIGGAYGLTKDGQFLNAVKLI